MKASQLLRVAARVARGIDVNLLQRLAQVWGEDEKTEKVEATEKWLGQCSKRTLLKLQELVMDMEDELEEVCWAQPDTAEDANGMAQLSEMITDELMSRD